MIGVGECASRGAFLLYRNEVSHKTKKSISDDIDQQPLFLGGGDYGSLGGLP